MLNDVNPLPNYVLVELHVPDFAPVKAYYARLDFETVREDAPDMADGYLVLKMQNNILCFWAGNEYVYEQSYFKRFPRDTKRGYGVEIVLMVADVESYYKQVQDLANIVEPLRLRPWGLQDFRMEDPFGYYLRVTELHNILKSKNHQVE